MRASICTVLMAALLLAVPGSAKLKAETETKVIKISTIQVKTSELTLQEKRTNEKLAAATNGRIQIRFFYGGTQGDDKTAMRKMRAGQIDAAPLGVDVVTQAVHQCTVLMMPQTFTNWKQVDAVRDQLAPEFNKEAYDNGFKVLGWWDLGQARIFSKKPIRSFDDLRNGRPWLYPENAPLKEFYKMINATGIPLDLSEVYGGLMTNMIDVVWISPVLGAQLSWVSKTSFVLVDAGRGDPGRVPAAPPDVGRLQQGRPGSGVEGHERPVRRPAPGVSPGRREGVREAAHARL